MHNTQSSLACPDWPLCHGQFFPKMTGSILIEHGHRLLASLVGFLCLLLWMIGWKNRQEDERGFHLSTLCFFLVLFQGGLGGVTVIYKLPTIVSTLHLAVAMVFICLLIYYHRHLCSWKEEISLPDKQKNILKKNWDSSLKEGMGILLFLIYVQILLGAFIRHSGAGAACGLGTQSAFFCIDIATWTQTLWPSMIQGKIHMLHRYLAVLVFFFALYFSFRIIDFMRKQALETKRRYMALAAAVPFVLLLQIGLGVMTVAGSISLIPTTAHLAVAALSLALCFVLFCEWKKLEKKVWGKKIHGRISDFLQLTKPRLLLLVMVTSFIGMQLSTGEIPFFSGVLAMLCIAMVVGGANTLNCYMERETDGRMERTCDRPLPAGRMQEKEALYFGGFLIGAGVGFLALWINWQTASMAFAAAFFYLCLYTPLKQKSKTAVYVGAVPGAIPPLLGQMAVGGKIELSAIALFIILFIWQLPHFLAISLFYSQDYAKANIEIYPNISGIRTTKYCIVFFTALLFAASFLPVHWEMVGAAYTSFAGILSGAFLLLALAGLIKKPVLGFCFSDDSSWGRSYYWASLAYLPLLFLAVVFLK